MPERSRLHGRAHWHTGEGGQACCVEPVLEVGQQDGSALRAAHDLVPYPEWGKFAEVRMVYCRRCGATQPVEAGERNPLGPCLAALPPSAPPALDDEDPDFTEDVERGRRAGRASLDVERLALALGKAECGPDQEHHNREFAEAIAAEYARLQEPDYD